MGDEVADGVDLVHGRVLKTADTSTTLDTMADWYACLADRFNLPLSDVDERRRRALWEKVTKSHERWLASA